MSKYVYNKRVLVSVGGIPQLKSVKRESSNSVVVSIDYRDVEFSTQTGEIFGRHGRESMMLIPVDRFTDEWVRLNSMVIENKLEEVKQVTKDIDALIEKRKNIESEITVLRRRCHHASRSKE